MFLTTLDRTHDGSFRGFSQFLSATLNPRHTPRPGPCRRPPQPRTDSSGPRVKLTPPWQPPPPAGPLWIPAEPASPPCTPSTHPREERLPRFQFLVPSQGPAGGPWPRGRARGVKWGLSQLHKGRGSLREWGDRWQSHARGRSFPRGVQSRGGAWHLGKLESLGRAAQSSDRGSWVCGLKSLRKLPGHFPFPTAPHSLSFVQNMLICVLNALRRPAGGEPTLFNCLLFPNDYHPQNLYSLSGTYTVTWK